MKLDNIRTGTIIVLLLVLMVGMTFGYNGIIVQLMACQERQGINDQHRKDAQVWIDRILRLEDKMDTVSSSMTLILDRLQRIYDQDNPDEDVDDHSAHE